MQKLCLPFAIVARMDVPFFRRQGMSVTRAVDVQDVLVGEVDILFNFSGNLEHLVRRVDLAPFFQIHDENARVKILIIVVKPDRPSV